mmetsp:Transcript_1727/g.5018  ORF Transcript_1727/g.5018 Transcript_1727/m.5018 type:complete len:383 (-) Transcript_1727:630-1778(-)
MQTRVSAHTHQTLLPSCSCFQQHTPHPRTRTRAGRQPFQTSNGSLRRSGSLHFSAIAPGLGRSGVQRQSRLLVQVTRASADGEKMTIAITGATGLVGSRLVSKLSSQGHSVRVLTRNVGAARNKLPYGRLQFYAPAEWASAFDGATGVVNLAGEPIATRWTPAHKAEIKRSRVATTRAIADAVNSLPEDRRPRVLVSTSAVGYYGVSDTETFSEKSGSGQDFLSEVCREWEAAADDTQVARKVVVRSGIVLAREGGALAKMLPVFNVFAGGPLGSGRQWFSWIHRDDLVSLIIEALTSDAYSGVYNGTAPNPVRMSELCSQLGTVLGRPSWLPVPDFALQTLLGEGAGVVLDGQRVLPARAQEAGFKFKFPEVSAALKSVAR